MIGEKTKAVDLFWQECRKTFNIETSGYHACSLADPRYLDPSVPNLDLSDHPRLIRNRQKNGTAHLEIDFVVNGTPRRAVGDYWLIVDFDSVPLYLVRIIDVLVFRFSDVPQSWAEVEGEGDCSLAWWRDAHRDYFSRQCALWGVPWHEDMQVVCERWDLVACADGDRVRT